MQILAGELARFATTQGLDFDERSLLEHLLSAADHRTGQIDAFTPTDLARTLGLGPSAARRTLPTRLECLGAAGALTWVRGRPGPLEVVVYSRLVHGGPQDTRRGFVQLVPAAITRHARRHHLSPTATAVLTRLLLEADSRTQAVAATTPRQLVDQIGLGRRRLEPAIDELVAIGSIAWSVGQPLHVTAYAQLVRAAPAGAPRGGARPSPGRAPDRPDRAPDGNKARDAIGSDSHAQDPDCEPKTTTPPDPPNAPTGGALDGRGWDLLDRIKTNFTEAQCVALDDPVDRTRLGQLSIRLECLLDGGWVIDELVAYLGAPLPDPCWSPARLLGARAGRLPTSPPTSTTKAETAETATATAEKEAQAEAELRFRRECQDARRQGIDFVRWGNDRHDLVALHAGDGEALAAALAGYDEAQVASDHGRERARAGGDRFGLSDDYGDELLWAAQAGYDEARETSPSRFRTGAREESRMASLAARAALVGCWPGDDVVAQAGGSESSCPSEAGHGTNDQPTPVAELLRTMRGGG